MGGPPNGSTPDLLPYLKGSHRDRALMQTLLGSMGLQIATVSGTLVTWPLMTRSLSTAEFGAYAVITGVHALLGLMDFGVGSALALQLAHAAARGESARMRVLVAAALLASVAAGVLVAVFGAAAALLPWGTWLAGDDLTSSEIRAGIVAMAIALGLTIPGYLGFRILFALQRGATVTRLLIAFSLGTTTALVATALLDGPLWTYIVVAIGLPAVLALGATVWVIRTVDPSRLLPDLRAVRWPDVRALLGHSGWFWVLSVCAAIGFQSDSLIVAGMLGAAQAGVFAVVVRMIGLISATVQPSVLQLAPAFTDALTTGDLAWVRRRLRTITLSALFVAGGMSGVMVMAAPIAIEYWLTPELVPPTGVLIAAGVWQTYILASEPMFLLIQAAGRVRVHAWMALAMISVNVPVSIALTATAGLAGPLWGSLIANIVCAGIPAAWYVRRLLRTLDQRATIR